MVQKRAITPALSAVQCSGCPGSGKHKVCKHTQCVLSAAAAASDAGATAVV